MNKQKAPNFILVIIAAIVSSGLYKQIDFDKMTVEKPALSAVYFITLIAVVFLIVKNFKNLKNNQ